MTDSSEPQETLTPRVQAIVSLEQRMFEAAMRGKGIRLSFDDLMSLVSDDAIDTRISNVAAIEAGEEEEPGVACIRWNGESWNDFKRRLSG